MTRYCEECGSRLSPGTRFCENCGSPVEGAASVSEEGGPSPADLCDDPAWPERLKAAQLGGRVREVGILYTHSTRLRDRLGVGTEKLLEEIEGYLATSYRAGILYFYFDLARNAFASLDSMEIADHVALLGRLRDRMRMAGTDPRFLLILGGDDVVPMGVLPNQSRDPDEAVESDLPFATLSTASPWEGSSASLVGDMLVGRIPTARALNHGSGRIGSGGSESAPLQNSLFAYFESRKAAVAAWPGWGEPAGLAAAVWEESSRSVFAQLGGGDLLLSPETSLDNLRGRFDFRSRLLYFNVHGSERTPFWYGQAESGEDAGTEEYPRVFSPDEPPLLDKGYVLGTEACYGTDLRRASSCGDSILLSALCHGCLAFVGSSRIAYGTTYAPPRLADLVVLGFLKGMREGNYAGEALREARKTLAADRGLDDCTIKTLIEFSLFGDPALRLSPTEPATPIVPMPDIGVPTIDIRRAVAMELASVNDSISRAIEAFVRERHADFRAAKPTYYRMGNSTYQAIFQLPQGSLGGVLKVYFDGSGQIIKEYRSK